MFVHADHAMLCVIVSSPCTHIPVHARTFKIFLHIMTCITMYKFSLLFVFHLLIGTNDVTFATAIETTSKVMVTTQFCRGSAASGALFSFVFLTEDEGVNFNKSALLALDRNTSLNHTLPFSLHPGHYRVYVYDIEQDGTLSTGVLYPAATDEIFVFSQGMKYLSNIHKRCFASRI